MSYFSISFRNVLKTPIKKFIKMSEKAVFDKIKHNSNTAKQTIQELKSELEGLSNTYNVMLAQQLREENARLLAAVENARKKLVTLEVKNGVTQVPVPNQTTVLSTPIDQPPEGPKSEPVEVKSGKTVAAKDSKPKKEKKPKETPAELPIDIGRLDLRIAKVEDVQRHPDADSLYMLKINCGEEKPRTVCSGLVKHVPIEELRDRTVVLLCNLKPVKMRGVTSEAMVMCASSEQGVEVLSPPSECSPGDHVHCDGYTRQPDAVMNPKKKIFETVAPDLHTNDVLQACYKGIPLNVPNKGNIVAKTLKNVPVK